MNARKMYSVAVVGVAPGVCFNAHMTDVPTLQDLGLAVIARITLLETGPQPPKTKDRIDKLLKVKELLHNLRDMHHKPDPNSGRLADQFTYNVTVAGVYIGYVCVTEIPLLDNHKPPVKF